MTKQIDTIVDSRGNVQVGFAGFIVNDECTLEEERLRRGMSDLGVQFSSGNKHHKSVSNDVPLPLDAQMQNVGLC